MVRVGLLGVGAIGTIHANAWATIPDAEVVSVAALDAERTALIASRLGARVAGSIDDVLDDSSIELVDICLPTPLHPATAIAAARAGKDVICEKPLALDLKGAENMIAARREAGVHLFPAMVVRFFPQYTALAHAVRDGAVGTPASATLLRQGFYPLGHDGWYRDSRQSGGIFFDLMIHDFDWALWQFGSADRVYARLCNGIAANPFTQGTATVHHESGVLSQITGTWGHPGPFTTAVEISGDEGLLQYDSNNSSALQIIVPEANSGETVPLPQLDTSENPYRIELAHFVDVIEGRAEPIVRAEDFLSALRLADAARESASTGRAVLLHPVAER